MSQKGQSIIEYTLIFILVITGIIVGGPYIIRSIHAHFRLWDQAVQDSYDDQTVQAAADQITITTQDCSCDWMPTECGLENCYDNERLYVLKCTPANCSWNHQCRAENATTIPKGKDACCSKPVRTGECWRGLLSNPMPNKKGTNIPMSFRTNCQLGDRVFEFSCGDHVGKQVCQEDHTTEDGDRDCRPACLIEEIPYDASGPIAKLCNEHPVLENDTPVTYIAKQTNCPSDNNIVCQAYCKEGYEIKKDLKGQDKCEPIPQCSENTVVNIDFPKIVTGRSSAFDGAGKVLLNYKTGLLSLKYSPNRLGAFVPAGSIVLTFNNGTKTTISYSRQISADTTIQLPGVWNNIPSANLTLSNVAGRNGHAAPTIITETNSIGWAGDDSSSDASGSVFFDIAIQLTRIPCNQCQYTRKTPTIPNNDHTDIYCFNDDTRINIRDIGSGRSHAVEKLNPNGCRATEGSGNSGEEECLITCIKNSYGSDFSPSQQQAMPRCDLCEENNTVTNPTEDTIFCFNASGCIKENCDVTTFKSGQNCYVLNSLSCKPLRSPKGWPLYKDLSTTYWDIGQAYASGGVLSSEEACYSYAPLNNDLVSVIAFCKELGFSTGELIESSFADDCGWVFKWDSTKKIWTGNDEGSGGNRTWAYRIKCTIKGLIPDCPNCNKNLCGNGVLDKDEDCDDGNLNGSQNLNSCCSKTCTLIKDGACSTCGTLSIASFGGFSCSPLHQSYFLATDSSENGCNLSSTYPLCGLIVPPHDKSTHDLTKFAQFTLTALVSPNGLIYNECKKQGITITSFTLPKKIPFGPHTRDALTYTCTKQ